MYVLSGMAFIVYIGNERIVSSVHVVNVLSGILLLVYWMKCSESVEWHCREYIEWLCSDRIESYM